MSKIYIVSQFTSKFDEYNPNRYGYIWGELSKEWDTNFITSSFDHVKKREKIKTKNQKVQYVYEPGYKSNKSIRRVLSHLIFSFQVFLLLLLYTKKNDVLIIAIPSNALGFFGTLIKQAKGCYLILDIHDTWPESLMPLMVFRNFFLSVMLKLWALLRNYAIARCDFLTGESEEYVRDFMYLLPKNAKAYSILLGLETERIEKIKPFYPVNKEKINIVFAGTIGINYDLDTVVGMIQKYGESLSKRIDFHFWGEGERLIWLKNEIGNNENVYFEDRVSYKEYIARLKGMDIGLNSFIKRTNVKYSYKSTDYLACGVAVLNSLSGSFGDDVMQYNLGLNYVPGSTDSLYLKLTIMVEKLLKNRSCYKKDIAKYVNANLERKNIYKPLFSYIRSLNLDGYNFHNYSKCIKSESD
ncbi:MAG: glycosyltransferase WbuB [Firmicutes bacterium]|nr:glycosyltransferase WbuB [Bacillota bacterium]